MQEQSDIQLPSKLLESMRNGFIAYGEIQEDGKHLLTEVSVRLDRFTAVIRPNESQHRGRPHCVLQINDDNAVFDIETGELMAGSLRRWNRTAEKVVCEHSRKLKEIWDKTRPDDQKLN